MSIHATYDAGVSRVADQTESNACSLGKVASSVASCGIVSRV